MDPPFLQLGHPRACGFRDLWADRRRLLGEESGALDRIVDGWWNDRRVRWPVWKWYWEAQNVDLYAFPGTAPGALERVRFLIRDALDAGALAAAAEDAQRGAYGVPAAWFREGD
jgi:hypothetical protein